MAGKIQNEDVKSVAELVADGATAASLPNDDKVYVTASGLNKTLKQAIIDGDLSGGTTTRQTLIGSGTFVVPAGVTSLTLYSKVLSNTIAGAGRSSIALKTDGYAWTWGPNTTGNLGDNTNTDASSPVQVAGNHIFVSAYSYLSTLALKADGSAWAWGANTQGGLGDNTLTAKSSPVAVAGGHVFTKISTGNAFSLALKADGSAWTWGNSSQGLLGNNTLTDTSSPVAVVGGHIFVDAVASAGTVALKADGSAWTWGVGIMLGDNATTNQSSPVAVVGGHVFTDIALVAAPAVCALKADGSAWTWGQGANGVLGDNTATSKSSPVAVAGGHIFAKLARGGSTNTFAALKADGSAWTWGLGSFGGLGDNTTTTKSSPVAVAGGHKFIEISIGNSYCLARKSDGSVWAWGRDNAGELGNNDLTDTSSPVQVAGQYFAQLNSSNNTQALKKTIIAVTPAQSIDYATGTVGFFGTTQLAAGIAQIIVEYTA